MKKIQRTRYVIYIKSNSRRLCTYHRVIGYRRPVRLLGAGQPEVWGGGEPGGWGGGDLRR